MGTKIMHKGNNTRSRTVAKGICAGSSKNYYKGLVQVHSIVKNLTNSSQCDSMLIGDNATANTYPYIQVLHFLFLCLCVWDICIILRGEESRGKIILPLFFLFQETQL